jgi:hypothetical protein
MDTRAVAALAITLGASAWGVVTSVRIMGFLQSRGRSINLLLMRWKLFDYVSEYRRITRAELGRPGILYTHFTTAWILALGAAFCAVLLLRLT